MRLLIIRHAIAVSRGTPGTPDDERPLTPRGRRRFRRAARGLARILGRPDALLTSPLIRALATAEIAAREWGRVKPTIEPALARGNPSRVLAVLASQPADATIAIVGHEPYLSGLLSTLLGCAEADRLAFRKGGAALLDLPGSPAEGARLLWFLPPKLLRRLARRG
jgi:phosphohistidine phosphatase